MGYTYFYCTVIMSILSLLGDIIIIATFFAFKSLRTSGRKLLVYLSIADFLTALGNLMGISWYTIYMDRKELLGNTTKMALVESELFGFCQFHAALTFFSTISSYLWTTIIGVHLHLCIVQNKSTLAERMVWLFHVICWLIPGKYTLQN